LRDCSCYICKEADETRQKDFCPHAILSAGHRYNLKPANKQNSNGIYVEKYETKLDKSYNINTLKKKNKFDEPCKKR